MVDKTKIVETHTDFGIPIRMEVPEDLDETQWKQGIPVSIDYEFLKDWYDIPDHILPIFAEALKKEGVVMPADLWRDGVYKRVNLALKQAYKIVANDIVYRLRSEYHDRR